MAYPWLANPASDVALTARELLGWHLVANDVTVRLTEVEAYSGMGADPASHAHRGPTNRNAVMFGPAGFVYVYFVYGMYECANNVCGAEGEAAAVLLRAGQVVDGVEAARQRRPAARTDDDLARGPAKLVQALGIDRSANGTSAVDGSGPLLMIPPPEPVPSTMVSAGPRVGVNAAHDVPWRFWITGDPTVSAYRRHVPRERRAAQKRTSG